MRADFYFKAVFLLALCLLSGRGQACTIGVANGVVTTDGRPVLFKNRDIALARQMLGFFPASPYSYIAVHSEGGGPNMGLNEKGVAAGSSAVSTQRPPGVVGGSTTFHHHILQNCKNMDEIRAHIHDQVMVSRVSGAGGCLMYMDAEGNASIFEVNRNRWYIEYNSMDPVRASQDLFGLVVRANEFHERKDGTDDLNIKGRYETARYNVTGLRDLGLLNASTIIQGNDGSGGYEVIRYGPGRPLERISRTVSMSTMIVRGVKPGEDPALATMWVMLGSANFGIAVPAWVRAGEYIPDVLKDGHMWDRIRDLYMQDDPETTQASTFPAETHLFNMVNHVLLPHWRENGIPAPEEMGRVQRRMAEDSYSLLACLSQTRADNKAPVIGAVETAQGRGRRVSFSVSARDPDGGIVSYSWDFGDGNSSSEENPRHRYEQSGTYLVSCTVKDNEGVTVTSWKYVTAPEPGGFLGGGRRRRIFRPGVR